MQDEVNEKTVSLCIRGGKITAQLLKAAREKLLPRWNRRKQNRSSRVKYKNSRMTRRRINLIEENKPWIS